MRRCRSLALSPKLVEAAVAAGRQVETCWRNECEELHLAPPKGKKRVAVKALDLDPEWVAAKKASEADGSLTVKVESVYMAPTDYSPMK